MEHAFHILRYIASCTNMSSPDEWERGCSTETVFLEFRINGTTKLTTTELENLPLYFIVFYLYLYNTIGCLFLYIHLVAVGMQDGEGIGQKKYSQKFRIIETTHKGQLMVEHFFCMQRYIPPST